MKKILICLLLTLAFVLFLSPVFAANPNQSTIDKGTNYLRSQQIADGEIQGFSGINGWAAIAFSAAGIDINTVASGSGQSLQNYLSSNPPSSSSTVTDWERQILAITAAGQNPYTFGGIDSVAKLKTYYTSNQIGSQTGVNDDAFGLLSLIASKVDASETIMTNTLTFLLSHQHTDGGFSYTTDTSTGSDIDDTAAVLMALQAAKTQNISGNGLDTAITNAKNYILSHQNTDGGFAYDPNPATSWDTSSNISTTAWVMMALDSLGLSGDSATAKAQTYLISAQQSNGSFPYQPSFPPGDTFDTSYAVTALTGKFWPIAIFSGDVPTTSSSSGTNPTTPTPTPTPTSQNDTTATTSSDSPTPIPTLVISSPTPTKAVKQAVQKSINDPKNSPTTIPSPTISQDVLGAKTKKTLVDSSHSVNWSVVFAILFAGIGVLSFGIFGWQWYKKKFLLDVADY